MKNFDSKQLGIQKKKVAFITDTTAATPFAQRILSGVAEYMQKRRGFALQNIPFTEILSDSLNRRFDGIIINLPALLGGASEDVYRTEFVQAAPEEPEEDVEISDEFEMPLGDE